MSSHSETPTPTPPKPQPPTSQPPSIKGPPLRSFLDVFAGVHAPLSQAAAHAGLDRYEPLDIISNSAHDILIDSTFESLLRLCWSGAIGLVCAPPCKEYSRLKMRPGGPPALRTPNYMDGVPGLSPAQLQKVRDNREIHRRGRALLHAVMCRGGVGSWSSPLVASPGWKQPTSNSFKSFKATLPGWTHAAMAKTGQKAGASLATAPKSAALQPYSNHNIEHQSIAGVKNA